MPVLASGVRTQEALPSQPQRGQETFGTGGQLRLDVIRKDIAEWSNKLWAYRIIVTMNKIRETDILCLCVVI